MASSKQRPDSANNPERLDSVRKELDTKIDSKVSNHVFYCILTFLIGFIGTSYWYTYSTNNKNEIAIENANNKTESINEKLIAIETDLKHKK